MIKNKTTIEAVFISLFLLSTLLLSNSPAYSQTPTEKLSSCIFHSINEQEKNSLMKWFVLAFAQHPEIKGVITPVDKTLMGALGKDVSDLQTSTLTKRCKKEFRELAKSVGIPAAFAISNETLGKVAGFSLVTQKDVVKELQRYKQLLDFDVILGVVGY
ncbi:MAG: hypothetical protein V6Z81_00495 [Parvularculales bacterium]